MPWDRTPDLGTAGGAAGPAPRRPRLCEPRPRAHRSTSLEGLAHARGGGQGLAQTRSPKGRRRRRRSSVCRTVFYDEGPGPRRGWGRRVPPREIKTSHGVANRTQSRGGKEGEAEGGQGAGRPRPRATPRVLLTLSDSAGRRERGRRRETADAGGGSRPGRPAREGGAEPGARGGPGPDQGARGNGQVGGRRSEPALRTGRCCRGGAPSQTGRAVVCTPHVARGGRGTQRTGRKRGLEGKDGRTGQRGLGQARPQPPARLRPVLGPSGGSGCEARLEASPTPADGAGFSHQEPVERDDSSLF